MHSLSLPCCPPLPADRAERLLRGLSALLWHTADAWLRQRAARQARQQALRAEELPPALLHDMGAPAWLQAAAAARRDAEQHRLQALRHGRGPWV